MFLLSQNDENQSENGSKNSKIRLRGTAKKDVANLKIEVKKLKSTGFFHFSLADFGRARSRTGVFRTVFYSVFWRRASRPIKNRRFWPKNAPPPGKPVTFYECHPEDHAPAPSVRADFVVWYIALLVVGFQLRDCRQCVMHKSTDILQVCVSYVHWFEDLIISSGLFRDD